MRLEDKAREVIAAKGDIPSSLREQFPQLFNKGLSPAAREARLRLARMELVLAEVRREMGFTDDEGEPDAKLIHEVADLFNPEHVDPLRRWFRLRLEGKLPSEEAQIAAAIALKEPALAENPKLVEDRLATVIAERARFPLCP
jgi:hypothetical protein